MKRAIPLAAGLLGMLAGGLIVALNVTPERRCDTATQMSVYRELGFDEWRAYSQRCKLDAVTR